MLEEVKKYLGVTWDDEDTDVENIIKRGKSYLNDLVGAALDYTTTQEAQEQYEINLAGLINEIKGDADTYSTEEAVSTILSYEKERDSVADKSNPAVNLLFNYCRYDYNNAVELFKENFQDEIRRLQLEVAVEFLACLSNLTIEGLTLTPEFESRAYKYTATTTDESNVITVTAINEDANIEIMVNGEEHENETGYTWQSGENVVKITVTDGSSEKVYTVVVTYEK
jgi:hypothetical protein